MELALVAQQHNKSEGRSKQQAQQCSFFIRPILLQDYFGTILRYYFVAGAEIVERSQNKLSVRFTLNTMCVKCKSYTYFRSQNKFSLQTQTSLVIAQNPEKCALSIPPPTKSQAMLPVIFRKEGC
jgi:hypothetical protein